eukprot:jgi/Chrzof1/2346/Cz11g11230.t1
MTHSSTPFLLISMITLADPRFTFGKTPPPESEDEAFRTPCFTQCPSKAVHRRAVASMSTGSSSSSSSTHTVPGSAQEDCPSIVVN